jgi:hypothetical protein
MRTGHHAVILWVKRDGTRWRWTCEHVHRDEVSAFACATRETRRRFATPRPKTHIDCFNVMTQPVLKGSGETGV